MQSLSRAIERGNAVIYFDLVTKTNKVCYKKGSTESEWKNALKNALKNRIKL